jgi:hypothetical protein
VSKLASSALEDGVEVLSAPQHRSVAWWAVTPLDCDNMPFCFLVSVNRNLQVI